MTLDLGPRRTSATCRIVDEPRFTIVVEGEVDAASARRVAEDLSSAAGSRRGTSVLDLTAVAFADRTGVRLLRTAVVRLVRSGRRIQMRTADPVARWSSDVARVA
jgi:anti-anti-sigma factor